MRAQFPESIQRRIYLLHAAVERADSKLNAARSRAHALGVDISQREKQFENAKRAYRGAPTLSGTLAAPVTPEELRELEAALKQANDDLVEVRGQIGDLTSGKSFFDPNGLMAIAGNQHALLDTVEKFLAFLPPGDELIAAYAPPGTSDDVSEAGLAAIRMKLSEAEAERGKVSASVASAVFDRDFLARWAVEKAAGLEVQIGEGTRIGRSDTDDRRRPIFTPSNPSTVTLLAATVPELFVEAIIRAVDRTATQAGKRVLNPAERERQLAELDAEILSLQRQEEAVITSLAAAGIYVPRRRGADPRAVLMVEVRTSSEAEDVAAAAGTSSKAEGVAELRRHP